MIDSKLKIHYQNGTHFNPGYYLNESAHGIVLEEPFEVTVEPVHLDGIPHWFLDNHRIQDETLRLAATVPIVYYSQPEFTDRFVQKKKCLIPYGYHPKFHKKHKVEKIYDVGFIGEDRGDVAVINKIKENFNAFVANGLNCQNEYAEALSKCKVLFNHSRRQESNMRFFESLPIGPLVTYHHYGIEQFGEPEKDFLTYKEDQDAIEQIKRLLSDEKLRNTIEKNGRKLAKERHTYRHRLLAMLDYAGVKYKINGKDTSNR